MTSYEQGDRGKKNSLLTGRNLQENQTQGGEATALVGGEGKKTGKHTHIQLNGEGIKLCTV